MILLNNSSSFGLDISIAVDYGMIRLHKQFFVLLSTLFVGVLQVLVLWFVFFCSRDQKPVKINFLGNKFLLSLLFECFCKFVKLETESCMSLVENSLVC